MPLLVTDLGAVAILDTGKNHFLFSSGLIFRLFRILELPFNIVGIVERITKNLSYHM